MYKQVKTFTKEMSNSGDQEHIGKVSKLDPALKGAYFKNLVVTWMANITGDTHSTEGCTIYLSNASGSEGWSDDAVIAARAIGGMGGVTSLTANRAIKTDVAAVSDSTGPIHIWAEVTDASVISNQTSRFTLEAWGRMIVLTEDDS